MAEFRHVSPVIRLKWSTLLGVERIFYLPDLGEDSGEAKPVVDFLDLVADVSDA